MLNVDVVDRNAELVGDDLRKRRLVALTVRMRPGEDGHLAGRMHAHLARFEQARACAERAGDIRRREPARLDVAGVAKAAQHAAQTAIRFARSEAPNIGEFDRAFQRRLVVTDVVRQSDR